MNKSQSYRGKQNIKPNLRPWVKNTAKAVKTYAKNVKGGASIVKSAVKKKLK